MSGTYPVSIGIASAVIQSLTPTLISTSQSLKQQARSRGGQRWGFKLSYQNRQRSEIDALTAFLVAQRGQFESFQITPPVYSKRKATGTSAVHVSANTAAGRSVPVAGAAAAEQIGKQGDFVKFAGHSKVYMLTADATADGTGAATLSIEPALYAAVASAEAVDLDTVTWTVRCVDDLKEFSIVPATLTALQVNLVEAL